MLGVVSKNAVDHLAVEEMPALLAQRLDIGPARPYVQRFVDREPRTIQREYDRDAGEDSHEQRVDRSTNPGTAVLLGRKLAAVSSRHRILGRD